MNHKTNNNLDALYILWLRQVKKYLRSPARIIGSLGQPLLFLLALGFGLGGVFAAAGKGSYITFLTPGVIAMAVIFTAMFSGIELIWDRQFGFLKETMVAPVSRMSIAIGRTLGGATVATIQGILVFFLSFLFGFRPLSIGKSLLAFLALFLIAIFFTALGTAIASKLRDMQAFPIIMNFVIMPLFFLSGALFPSTGIPTGLMIAVKVNPLSYGVDMLRGFLIGGNVYSMAFSIILFVVLCIVSLLIVARLFERIEV